MRKAIIAAIVIKFKKAGKEDILYNSDRNPYCLPKILEIAKQEGYLSSYLYRQLIREVRVFGDVGTHDYKIDFKEDDVISLFKLLRLALERIYHEKK